MTVSPLPQAVDQEYAELAAAVYDNGRQQVGRWTRIFDPALKTLPAGIGPTAQPDATSGFKAALYTDGERHVLAFAGSERETRDWLTNLGQAVGLDTAQYGQAACFAKECKDRIELEAPGKNTFTKHRIGVAIEGLEAKLNSQSVTVAEGLLGHEATAKQLADTFRSKDARDGVKEHPGLQNAYRLLGVLEAKASTMGKEAGENFRQLARANLADRIERGEKLPPAPSQEREQGLAKLVPASARSVGPER